MTRELCIHVSGKFDSERERLRFGVECMSL